MIALLEGFAALCGIAATAIGFMCLAFYFNNDSATATTALLWSIALSCTAVGCGKWADKLALDNYKRKHHYDV